MDDPTEQPSATFDGSRLNYDKAKLLESEADPDPFVQLRRWLDEASEANSLEPTAMTVSTLGADERVHSRTVLMRQLTAAGLVFFTNRSSNKGNEMGVHPVCAAQFMWHELQRQVRVEGTAKLLDDRAADEYFAGRPRGSQIGAWASPQSQPLESREELESLVASTTQRFADVEVIPRPSNWGGYRIEPDTFEFWQGRPSRLHDRLRYRLDFHGHWRMDRLAP